MALSSLGVRPPLRRRRLCRGDARDPAPRSSASTAPAKLEPHHVRELLPDLCPARVECRSTRRRESGHLRARALPGARPPQDSRCGQYSSRRSSRRERESRVVQSSRAAAFAALAPSTIFQLHTAGPGLALSAMSRLMRAFRATGSSSEPIRRRSPARSPRSSHVADRLSDADSARHRHRRLVQRRAVLRESLESVLRPGLRVVRGDRRRRRFHRRHRRDRTSFPVRYVHQENQGQCGRQERRSGTGARAI